MLGADAPSEIGDHLVIRAAPVRRLDHLWRELQVLVAAGGVNIVVFQEHGGWQDDIRIARGVGHELLVNAREEVVARKSAPDLLLIRSDGQRIGILDQHRANGPSPFQRLRLSRQYRADA